MFNRYFVLLVLVVGVIWGFNHALETGQYRNYIDQHPSPILAPPILYFTGLAYGLVQNLPEAATYYTRVMERYPQSEYADDSNYEYLQTLEERMTLTRKELADEYDRYLERYPHAKHAVAAKNRSSILRLGA